MNSNPRPVCKVCRRPLEESEQYLVRIDGPRTTAVHRSLCFPPARTAESRRAHRAA
jgi:protein-disulfide isomerase